MNKFSKTLSVLLSAAMGLSFHASSFKSFAMNGNIPLKNSVNLQDNILNKEDIKKEYYFYSLYRTAQNILVNRIGIPLNKNLDMIGNADNDIEYVYVPSDLFERVPLHPAIDAISKDESKKFILKLQNGEIKGSQYPFSMLVNEYGQVLTVNTYGDYKFTDSIEDMKNPNFIKAAFTPLVLPQLDEIDSNSDVYKKLCSLSDIYVKTFNDKVKDWKKFLEKSDEDFNTITVEAQENLKKFKKEMDEIIEKANYEVHHKCYEALRLCGKLGGIGLFLMIGSLGNT